MVQLYQPARLVVTNNMISSTSVSILFYGDGNDELWTLERPDHFYGHYSLKETNYSQRTCQKSKSSGVLTLFEYIYNSDHNNDKHHIKI